MEINLCSCKGIRICSKCEESKKDIVNYKNKDMNSKTSINLIDEYISANVTKIDEYTEYEYKTKSNLFNCDEFEFNKVLVISNHLSENDQKYLFDEVNKHEWKSSQSGRLKQDYGVKINYKKKKVKQENFTFPLYKEFIEEKLKIINNELFNTFTIDEIGNLFYKHEKGAHIEPHIDDSWIWGSRIIGINLLSDTKITFSKNISYNNKEFYVYADLPLKKGDIYLMTNNARYSWYHSISKENLNNDRLVITLREFDKNYLLLSKNENLTN